MAAVRTYGNGWRRPRLFRHVSGSKLARLHGVPDLAAERAHEVRRRLHRSKNLAELAYVIPGDGGFRSGHGGRSHRDSSRGLEGVIYEANKACSGADWGSGGNPGVEHGTRRRVGEVLDLGENSTHGRGSRR